jgi:dipeptidyl aminopeptidase/acylaminoacyl peptidase
MTYALPLTRGLLGAFLCLASAAGCSSGGGKIVQRTGTDAAGLPDASDANSADHSTVVINLPDAPLASETAQNHLPQNIVSMRITPLDAVLVVERGKTATLGYHAYATMQGDSTEVDITSRTIFYVPDNYLAGGFPEDGSATFSSRLPASPSDPPQRGGKVTIQAQAASTDLPVTTITTTLTVKIVDTGTAAAGTPAATPAIPSNPGTLFTGTDTASMAPLLIYPNDGVLLPPNMNQLEIHYMPGKSTGELYEISLLGPYSEYRYYTRCYADPAKFVKDTCAFEIDPDTARVIAESNRGAGPLKLTIRGSDEHGKVGATATASIEFAADAVNGAITYWTATRPPRIMRFDFGSQSGLAPVVEQTDLPDDAGNPGKSQRCIGCHAVSRDGSRLVAGMDGAQQGYLLLINDLSRPKTDPNWLTVDGRGVGVAAANQIVTASFNPDGSQFVAVSWPENTLVGPTKLAFHDGTTGVRKSVFDVGFNVTYPDWSPDGQSIAVTRIYQSNSYNLWFYDGGISIIQRDGGTWKLPAVDLFSSGSGNNRYTPNWLPDSSLLLYSESVPPPDETNPLINAYSNSVARVWAIEPKAGATPVALARANATGVADKLTLADNRGATLVKRIAGGQLMNTFPRSAPFQNKHNGHTLFWFTVASQRRAGVRCFVGNESATLDASTQTLLWMFALDADAVHAGTDGSYPGFFLPFQDMLTSNHMAYWAQKYVSDNPPPPPPPTPEPPPLTVTPPIP